MLINGARNKASDTPVSPPSSASGFPKEEVPEKSPLEGNPARFHILEAERSHREGPRVTADGSVHFLYRGYDVRADHVEGNLDTQIFLLVKSVHIVGKDQDGKGERVIADFKNRTFRYEDGRARLDPSTLGRRLVEPLYIKGLFAGGTSDHIIAGPSSWTTCEFIHPHFDIASRSSDIVRGKRALLRHVTLTIKDKKILSLPYLLIPLDEHRDRYTPDVGHTRDEGYYIKNSFGVPLSGSNFMTTRLDYFSRLGNGFGSDLHYDNLHLKGLIRAYQMVGHAKSQLFSIDQRQDILGGKLTLSGQWIRDNYTTAPGQRNYNIRSAYQIDRKTGQLRLGLTRNSSLGNGFHSINQTWNLQDTAAWTKAFKTNLNVDFTRNLSQGSGFSSDRKIVNVSFRAQEDLTKADAQLDYQRSIPVGIQNGFFSASDRTPVLTLNTDSRRLLSARNADILPFRTELSTGQLIDGTTHHPITRTSWDTSLNKELKPTSDSRLTLDSRFKQGLYSDNTAQYVYGGGLAYTLGTKGRSSANFRYNQLRPVGYTPLGIDRTGESNEATGDVTWKAARTLSFGAQSAYDFLQLRRHQTAWQTLALRSDFQPNQKLLLRTQAGYDPFNRVWNNVRFDLGWKAAGGFISAGGRFDGLRHTWGNINAYADGLQWGKLKVSLLFNYNGYTKQFETKQYSFTYDLHDAEAILQILDNPVGFRSGRTISFFIRLKALPFDTPFGIGQRGQGFGTGTGTGF